MKKKNKDKPSKNNKKKNNIFFKILITIGIIMSILLIIFLIIVSIEIGLSDIKRTHQSIIVYFALSIGSFSLGMVYLFFTSNKEKTEKEIITEKNNNIEFLKNAREDINDYLNFLENKNGDNLKEPINYLYGIKSQITTKIEKITSNKETEISEEEKLLFRTNTPEDFKYIVRYWNEKKQPNELKKVFGKNFYLKGANLEGANLKNVNLSNANLEGTNLRNVNLSNANLEGTNFKGVNLNDTYF